MKRRIVSVLMALVMALSLLPVQALAEDAAVGEPVTEIEQAEQTGEGEEPGDPEEQTGEGEEPGEPEKEQEPGEPEEPVREFVQGEAQLTVSTAAMAAGTAGERTVPGDIYEALSVGGSLKLLNDVEYSGSMEVAFDLVIDLNGYVLKMGGTGRVIHIIKSHGYDVKVEIKDGEPGKEHTGEYAALPAGGVITGGKADKGGGILLAGGCTLKLTGGCITDCHATDTGGGGVVLNGDTAILYMSGTARIENCTAGETWGANAIFNSGTMYADGGTVDGTVNNQGTIKHSNGVTAVTVFKKAVYNQQAGTIEAGRYNETVENRGTITGGIFYGGVTNDGGKINDGAYETVTFNSDGGTPVEGAKVLRGQKVAKPTDDPTKSGYTFIGWEDADGAYDFSKSVIAPLTRTAKWEKVPSSGGYYYYQPTTDTKTDGTKGSPKTADPGAALYGALALLSLTGMVALNGKKR